MPLLKRGKPRRDAANTVSRPRLGVLTTHPIQGHAPLYRELSRRGMVELNVAYLSKAGASPMYDPGFDITLTWDIDLLGGYCSTDLTATPLSRKAAWLVAARRWLLAQDIVVLHGYSDPEILLAAVLCRLFGIPYLLRGVSKPEGSAVGVRRIARHLVAGAAVRNSAGVLPIGQLNAAFYRRYGRRPHYFAPYSVDNERFSTMSDAARQFRMERLCSLGLDPNRLTVIFCGKLIARKRPLDLIRAIGRADPAFNLLLLGDGPLRAEVRGYEQNLPVRCLGFINQAQLPDWYACGDILALPSDYETWGLVVNEAMACGLVPVTSDVVGCVPDLVHGVGEIFPVGDIDALVAALTAVASELPDRRERVRNRLAAYTVGSTAAGYEEAAIALAGRRLR